MKVIKITRKNILRTFWGILVIIIWDFTISSSFLIITNEIHRLYLDLPWKILIVSFCFKATYFAEANKKNQKEEQAEETEKVSSEQK